MESKKKKLVELSLFPRAREKYPAPHWHTVCGNDLGQSPVRARSPQRSLRTQGTEVHTSPSKRLGNKLRGTPVGQVKPLATPGRPSCVAVINSQLPRKAVALSISTSTNSHHPTNINILSTVSHRSRLVHLQNSPLQLPYSHNRRSTRSPSQPPSDSDGSTKLSTVL